MCKSIRIGERHDPTLLIQAIANLNRTVHTEQADGLTVVSITVAANTGPLACLLLQQATLNEEARLIALHGIPLIP